MKNTNSYPFRTKAQVIAQLMTDDTFVIEALGILYRNQTEDEKAQHNTKYRNRRGFMSSHAANGCKLVERMLGGEEWTPEEAGLARSIAVRYGKQLATHFRAEQIAAAPELGEKAACFFTTTSA